MIRRFVVGPLIALPWILYVSCSGPALQMAGADQIGPVTANQALLVSSVGSSYNFGVIGVNSGVSVQINIFNTGGVTANNVAPSLAASSTFTLGSSTCGTSLAPSSNCSLTLQFTATTATSTSGALSLSYLNGQTTIPQILSIALSGTGSSQGVGHLSLAGEETAVNFGSVPVGTQVQMPVVITSDGTVGITALTIGTFPVGGNFTYGTPTAATTPAACVQGGTLAPQSSCTLLVNFTAPPVVPNPAQIIATTSIGYDGTSSYLPLTVFATVIAGGGGGTSGTCLSQSTSSLYIPATARPVMDHGQGFLSCFVNGVLTTDQNAVSSNSPPYYPCGFNNWGYRNGNQSQYSVDQSLAGNSQPVLLASVSPGQVLYVNYLGGTAYGVAGSSGANCAKVSSSNISNGMPTLQFVNASGNVVAIHPRTGAQAPNDNNAIPAYSLVTNYIVVPSGAVAIYGSWPDNVYSDNSGGCSLELTEATDPSCIPAN